MLLAQMKIILLSMLAILSGLSAHKEAVKVGAVGTPIEQTTLINWDKPTTDAEWKEDVKNEQFDVRSDKVLDEMLISQTIKLAKEQEAFNKYQGCSQCIYWEKYQAFLAGGMDEITARIEAHQASDSDTQQRKWEIEKIQQSIERITHEKDLRNRKIVNRINIIDK